MRIFAYCFLFLLMSVAAKAQQPKIDSVKLKAMALEAQTYANTGNYDSAASLAKQIIVMGARDSSMYFMTAVVLTLAGKKAEGKLYYDTALAKGYDPNTQTALMLGLNTQPAHVNYDSMFAAVHSDAVRKSKHLPKGYQNAKLYEIYQEDQGERTVMIQEGMEKFLHDTTLLMRMVHNDSIRKQEIYAMLPNLKKSRSTEDIQEAALILQHGDDTTDYWNAHELAMRAVHLGDTNALWLAAATLDRYLVKKGKPQLYGTQSFQDEKTGKFELSPVDPSITDAERAKWHVPPLKDALKQANAVYGK